MALHQLLTAWCSTLEHIIFRPERAKAADSVAPESLGQSDEGLSVSQLDAEPSNSTKLVCSAALKHAGGEKACVCVVKETGCRTSLLASASAPDRALRLWRLSECGRNAEHLHTAAALPAPIVALHSSAQLGGKVFAGGTFPADVIQVVGPRLRARMRAELTLASPSPVPQ